MQAQSRPLGTYGSHSLWEVGKDTLPEIQDIVFENRKKAASKRNGRLPGRRERARMDADDDATEPLSTVYAIRGADNQWLGTLRLIEKNLECKLPAERDFGFQSSRVCQSMFSMTPNRVFEVTRFAVVDDASADRFSSRTTSDWLIASMLRHLGGNNRNLGVASFEAPLLGFLERRGIRFFPIKDALQRVSETTEIPAMLPIWVMEPELRSQNFGLYRMSGRNRVWYRCETRFDTTVHLASSRARISDSERIDGKFIDLSMGGAALQLPSSFATDLYEDRPVFVSFVLPETSAELCLRGRIVYRYHQEGAGTMRCGIEFVQPVEESVEAELFEYILAQRIDC